MNINETEIELVYDYNKDYYNVSNSKYLGYSPFIKPDILFYRSIQYDKRPELCYIRIKDNDQFVYVTENLIIYYSILQNDFNTKYRAPSVFYIAYGLNNEFIIYYSPDIYRNNIYYVKYDKINKKIYFTINQNESTRFIY